MAGLPELVVGGLADDDAQVLLGSVLSGQVDARVRDRIVAEAGGNPLALLELPRSLTGAELSGGFGMPGASHYRAASRRASGAGRRVAARGPAPTAGGRGRTSQ